MVLEKPNDLFMVGDPMQKIYERNINFSSIGINVRGKRSRRLRINYRTTEEIKKLAFSVVQDCHYDNFDGEEENKSGYVSLFHGNKPSYKLFKTKNDEIGFVISKVEKIIGDDRENQYNYGDIAICARTKNALKEIRNILHKEGLPYSDNTISKRQDSDNITLLTFHKIKGLEFKHVFLIDVNKRTFPKIPYGFYELSDAKQNSYLKNEKSLFYVALTRAIENIYISGTGEKADMIRLE